MTRVANAPSSVSPSRTGLIDRPVRFGEFKRPAKSVMRRERAAKGIRMFKPAELRRILADANPQVKAMVLLAVNCGFGNTDVTTLPLPAVDLAGGWVSYAADPRRESSRPVVRSGRRPQRPWRQSWRHASPRRTANTRVCSSSHSGANAWATGTKGATGVTHEFRKILDKLGLYRKGLSFYTLRTRLPDHRR